MTGSFGLNYTKVHCTALYTIKLLYITLHCTALYFTTLSCTALHCTVLQVRVFKLPGNLGPSAAVTLSNPGITK